MRRFPRSLAAVLTPPRPSGRGRRRAALLPLLVACLLLPLTACDGTSATPQAHESVAGVSVAGPFGTPPAVAVPTASAPPAKLTVALLNPGPGNKVALGDALTVNYSLVDWRTGKVVDSTFDPAFKHAQAVTAIEGQGVAPWIQELTGMTVGSRVMVIQPPTANPSASPVPQEGIQPTDTLVFIVDIISSTQHLAAGQAEQPVGDPNLPQVTGASDDVPTITIPPGVAPPSQLVVRDVITGQGPLVQKGDQLVIAFVGVLWRNGQVIDASTLHNSVSGFTVGEGQKLLGWDDGLVGQHRGSRVLLVLPPSEAYGPQGQPQAGILGTDTLVFVIDIID